MSDWVRVKRDWLQKSTGWNAYGNHFNLIPLKIGADSTEAGAILDRRIKRGKVFFREDISAWIKENNIAFESTYEQNYLHSIDENLRFLAIRFADPRDKLMFIMRFEE